MSRPLVLLSAFVIAGLGACRCRAAADGRKDAAELAGLGQQRRFDRYSPADQINTANVKDLRPVWIFPLKQAGGWEITPIVVDGVLYTQDMAGPPSRWTPKPAANCGASRPASRTDARRRPGGPAMPAMDRASSSAAMTASMPWTRQPASRRRVLAAPRATSISATASRPGRELRHHLAADGLRNLLITGPGTQEFGAKGPPGDPRAYDAITGKLVVAFPHRAASGRAQRRKLGRGRLEGPRRPQQLGHVFGG